MDMQYFLKNSNCGLLDYDYFISCYTTFSKDLRKMPMGRKCLAPYVNWFSFKIPDLFGTKYIGS